MARTGFNFAQARAQIEMVDAQVTTETNVFQMSPPFNCDTSRNAQGAVRQRNDLTQPLIHENRGAFRREIGIRDRYQIVDDHPYSDSLALSPLQLA